MGSVQVGSSHDGFTGPFKVPSTRVVIPDSGRGPPFGVFSKAPHYEVLGLVDVCYQPGSRRSTCG